MEDAEVVGRQLREICFGYAANPDGSVFGVWCPPSE